MYVFTTVGGLETVYVFTTVGGLETVHVFTTVDLGGSEDSYVFLSALPWRLRVQLSGMDVRRYVDRPGDQDDSLRV